MNNKENLLANSNHNPKPSISRHPPQTAKPNGATASRLRSPVSLKKAYVRLFLPTDVISCLCVTLSAEPEYDHIIIKALQFGIKVWDAKSQFIHLASLDSTLTDLAHT
jgi:hypothetical protein